MEKGVIVSIDQVCTYMNCLKKAKKGYITNIFDIQSLEEDLKNKELIFEYYERCYLNLFYVENGFYRLYFFIADLEHYEIENIGKTIVCDVFISQEDILFEKIKSKLYSNAFTRYDCVEKWMLRLGDEFSAPCIDGYIVDYEKKVDVVEEVMKLFDPYTDYLPDKSNIEAFIQDKNFINIYEVRDHKFVGSLIYTEKKRMAILEFFFVEKEYRGKGISLLLHECFYQMVSGKRDKIVSYIHENNVISIKIHQRYGYHKTNIKKVTFINYN